MEKFLELMAEAMEIEDYEISLETEFREAIDDFSSLVGFAMIVEIEDEYGIKITTEEFIEAKTFGDLYDKIPKE